MLKTCSACLQALEPEAFYRDASKRDGRHHRCKACDRPEARRVAAAMDLGGQRRMIRAKERRERRRLPDAVTYLPDGVALLRLGGQFAVGEHRYTIVDAEDAERLSAWSWKAKPNGSGSNVYAVRNVVIDGVNRTIRMHRDVLGLDEIDPRDVDHINGRSLDNRKQNLRAVTRSENLKNRKTIEAAAGVHAWVGPPV